MSRQQGIVTSIVIGYPLDVDDNADVQACIALLQAQQVSFSMRVHGSANKEDAEGRCRWEVDEEGWEALARAIQVKPDSVQRVEVSKDWLGHLRREDTEAIYEAIGDFFIVHRWEDSYYWDERWAQCMFLGSWEELEEVLDMSKDEFEAKVDPESEEYIYADGL